MNLLRVARLVGAWVVSRADVRSERGATAVEYAVMVALVATVVILAVVFLGETTSSSFSCTGQTLADRGATSC